MLCFGAFERQLLVRAPSRGECRHQPSRASAPFRIEWPQPRQSHCKPLLSVRLGKPDALSQQLKFEALAAVNAVDAEISDIQCRDLRDADGLGQPDEADIRPVRIDIGVLA
jgi:hypothetical protein